MSRLLSDLRYSLRLLLKTPVSTLIAIFSIALGIAANTVVFSAVNAILLKSLPYNDPERIVLVWGTSRENASLSNRDQVSATDIADLRKENTVFEDVATYTGWMPILSGYGTAERLPAIQVGDGYFKIMKGRPLLGRVFMPEEQEDGKDFVIILSYGLWQGRFAKDPNIIGKHVDLNGRSYTIVGVMPRDFHPLPASLVAPEGVFYRPVAEKYDDSQRDGRHLRAIARLKRDVTLQQAEAQVRLIGGQLEKAHPTTNNRSGFHVASLTDDTVGKLRPILVTLFATVVFVLGIACANVANLLLVRATVRNKELTIRTALGAGRERIIRQLLTESVMLSIAGGIVGFLLALWGIHSVRLLAAKISPLLAQIRLDVFVLVFASAISVATGILFGLAPALHAANPNLTEVLKEGTGRTTGGTGRSRLRNTLVVSEIAMAMTLLVSAGLLIQTMLELRKIDPGFSTENLLTMNIAVPGIKYPENENVRLFFDEVVERLNSTHGVRSAGVVSVLPLSANFDGRGIDIEGRPVPRGQEQGADMYVASPGYLRAMQIRIMKGRGITEQDKRDSEQIALISQSMAKQLWPNQDPIGKRIRLAGAGDTPWRSIVGIVADVSQYALEEKPPLQFYLPFDQFPTRYNNLVVKTSGDPFAMLQSVRSVILSVDKDQAVFNVMTMDDLLSGSVALKRLLTILLAAFSVLAVLLAAIGFYGVMSYAVAQRKQEIGIRMALGATRRQIGRLIVGEAMKLTLAGFLFGCVGAVFTIRLLAGLLFRVSPANPFIFLSVGTLLIAVAIASCLVPTLRAMNVAPAISLRNE